MKIEAFLFDLDGTLVNSIPLYRHAYLQTLRAFGLALTQQDFEKIYRENRKLTNVLARFGLSHRDAEIREYRNELYTRALSAQVTWFEDAKSFADSFDDPAPCAIVTGSWRSYVDAIEKRVDLSLLSSMVITADEYMPDGKPHPRSLLLAAERLDVAPERCIYVGDQDFDIHAARAAGMTDILIRREHTPPQACESASHIIQSLEELPALLAQMR
ncbi:MAG: HAD family phosphatase [Candidatus Peribacteraceae bacterium]|nr:HAD family phosphatase [Candidatus Peribacteraceae bacterium]MDD5741842.1 HAD family phosphatase [Candidatus Peribacteraceae bacterium]